MGNVGLNLYLHQLRASLTGVGNYDLNVGDLQLPFLSYRARCGEIDGVCEPDYQLLSEEFRGLLVGSGEFPVVLRLGLDPGREDLVADLYLSGGVGVKLPVLLGETPELVGSVVLTLTSRVTSNIEVAESRSYKLRLGTGAGECLGSYPRSRL